MDAAREIKSVRTTMHIRAGVADVWDKVCFYEEVDGRPTWFLRQALPLPLRTIGDHKTVGTVCRCEYSEGQYILKRITGARENAELAFTVIETSARFGRHIQLKGGTITLTATPGGTLVTMTTDYACNSGISLPRHLLIRAVIRAMHRFVIRDMAAAIRARQSLPMQASTQDSCCMKLLQFKRP